MWTKFTNLIRRGLAKIGLLQELQELKDHKKIQYDDETYQRIEFSKQIYANDVPDWHQLTYYTSDRKQHVRQMKRLGMGKVVANEMASLIFNEKVQINVSTRGVNDDLETGADEKFDAGKEFIKEVFDGNNFHEQFQRYLEYAYALGGMAVKVYAHKGKVKLAYADASAFFPLAYDNGDISEALFVNEERKDNKYYTLLEWNEWEDDNYVITNELYESKEANKLGTKVPLNTLYENLQERTVVTSLRRPLFVYFKPNTANNKDLQSPLGISLFENSHDTLWGLDYLYDIFVNEFKLGQRRIAVDSSMIMPVPNFDGETTLRFDPNETVFTALKMGDGGGVQDLSVDLRTEDIVLGINSLLEMLAMQTGFSSGTFTFDGKSVKTATEIISENSKTYRTKNSHEILIERGLIDLITTIIDVARMYDIYTGSVDLDVAIDFDDSIAESRDDNYKYYATAYKDKLIPQLETIKRVFKLTDKDALQWVEKINAETARPFEDELSDLIGISAGNVGD